MRRSIFVATIESVDFYARKFIGIPWRIFSRAGFHDTRTGSTYYRAFTENNHTCGLSSKNVARCR